MKKIIMNNESKKEALQMELDALQRKCSARTLDATDVIRILEKVEQDLDITKKALNGTKVHYDGSEHFPSAYKYKPECTHFLAEHNGKCWVVTNVYRGTCNNREKNTNITLSETAKEALLERHCFCRF